MRISKCTTYYKKLVLMIILWCIIIFISCCRGYRAWSEVIPSGIDTVEIECTWNGDDTTLVSCLNEVITQEEWSSAELVGGENKILLPINDKVTVESMLWRFLPQSEESVIHIYSVRLLCKEESILEYEDADLVEFFRLNSYSNMGVNIHGNEVELVVGTEGDSALCRFSQNEIDKIKNAVDAYKKENLLSKKQNVLVSFVQKTIVILVLTFWLVFFFDKLVVIFKVGKNPHKKDISHYEWIYMIRGMAIIAVVVCHQLHFLHYTEYLQMFSLYSVTTFIFCMGVTKWLSLEKAHESNKLFSYWRYTWKSLKSILCAYLIATICYLIVAGQFSYWNVLASLVYFSASGPLYFVSYVILFSLLAPILYTMIYKIMQNEMKILLLIMFVVSAFIIGYIIEPLGSTYLFVYIIGMIFSSNGFLKMNIFTRIGCFILWIGSVFVLYDHYFNEGILFGAVNRLVNKVNINPPNFSVMLYALACILLFYSIFTSRLVMDSIIGRVIIKKILMPLGKFSMDIFMWHLMIQHFFIIHPIHNIWLRRIIVYICMFYIPIVCRIMLIRFKNYSKNIKSFDKIDEG